MIHLSLAKSDPFPIVGFKPHNVVDWFKCLHGRDVSRNTQEILSVVPRNAIPRGIRQGETPGAEGTGMGFRQQMLARTQVRHATPAFAAGLAGT